MTTSFKLPVSTLGIPEVGWLCTLGGLTLSCYCVPLTVVLEIASLTPQMSSITEHKPNEKLALSSKHCHCFTSSPVHPPFSPHLSIFFSSNFQCSFLLLFILLVTLGYLSLSSSLVYSFMHLPHLYEI